MVIGPDYVFVSTPKCATNTMYDVLPKHFYGKRIGAWHNNRPPKRSAWKHTWTIVRNPYDRAVSIWGSTSTSTRYNYWELAGGKSFAAFAAWLARHPDTGNPVIMPMHKWLSGVRLDSVIHLESLREDMNKMPFWRDVELPRLNKQSRCEWTVYYTDDSIGANIRTWAGTDFEMFGYDEELTV